MQGKLKTDRDKIDFKDTKVESGRRQVCQFGSGSNENMAAERVQARYEQARKVNLPAKASLCDLDLIVDQKSFRYDDMFFFTTNGIVIASSLSTSMGKLAADLVQVGNTRASFKKILVVQSDRFRL